MKLGNNWTGVAEDSYNLAMQRLDESGRDRAMETFKLCFPGLPDEAISAMINRRAVVSFSDDGNTINVTWDLPAPCGAGDAQAL